METVLPIAILLSFLSVVAVLGIGIFSMIRGGTFNEKYGNKLMQWRVTTQAIAVLIVLLLVMVRAAAD